FLKRYFRRVPLLDYQKLRQSRSLLSSNRSHVMCTVERSAILLQKGTLCSIFRSGQLPSIIVMEKLSMGRGAESLLTLTNQKNTERCWPKQKYYKQINPNSNCSKPSDCLMVNCIFWRSIWIDSSSLVHILTTRFTVIRLKRGSRSEERRVGKECRSRWAAEYEQEKREERGDESKLGKNNTTHSSHRVRLSDR